MKLREASGRRTREGDVLQLHLVTKGASFTIYSLGDGDSRPLDDFVADLRITRPKEFEQIFARLERLAEHGPSRNVHEYRYFKKQRIFEVKTTSGGRVFGFYDKSKVIICTNGFMKKSQKTPSAQIDRAVAWRDRYQDARARETVAVI